MDTNKIAKISNKNVTKYRGAECLNCGHPLELSDKFCSYCSQLNTTKKLSVKDFFDELFSSIISYDSRFRQTLVTLIFKPGKITKEFVEGKRKKYANPFRAYLSISIVFFIIWGAIYNLEDIQFDEQEAIKELSEKGKKFSLDGIPKYNTAVLDSIISEKKSNPFSLDSIFSNVFKKDSLHTYMDRYISEESLDTLGFFSRFRTRFILYMDFYKETQIKSSKKALDSLNHTSTGYHKWIYKKAVDSNNLGQNMGDILSYFTNQLPFIIFFFLPIFAFFVGILYIRRKFTYTDHLIFLFHTQTMFFILYGIGIIIDAIFNIDTATTIASFVFLFYLYKAMRKFYQQRRIKTIVKFMLLNTIFFILAVVGTTIAFAISFATY